LAHQRWRNVSEYIRRLVNRDWERLKKIEGIAKVNAILEKVEGSGDLWPEDIELDLDKFRK
jgi:Arc/MetJ-type ribon-helix-helix transcriptional regulator